MSDVRMLLTLLLLLLTPLGAVIIQAVLPNTLLLADKETLKRSVCLSCRIPYLVLLELLHQHFVSAIYLAEFLSSILAGVRMMFLDKLYVLLSHGASARVLF